MIGDKQHEVGGGVDCKRGRTIRGNIGIVIALKKTAIILAKVKSNNISALICLCSLGIARTGQLGAGLL
jgi:hypothetical protein